MKVHVVYTDGSRDEFAMGSNVEIDKFFVDLTKAMSGSFSNGMPQLPQTFFSFRYNDGTRGGFINLCAVRSIMTAGG